MKINGVTVDAKKVIHKKAPRFTPAEAKKEATTFNEWANKSAKKGKKK